MRKAMFKRYKKLMLSIQDKIKKLPTGEFSDKNIVLYYTDDLEQELSYSDKKYLIQEIESKFKTMNNATFCQILNTYISKKKTHKSELYKAASIEKSYFYQIVKGTHAPSRDTAIRLCLALRLNLDESWKLLLPLGYTFYENSKRDIVITACICYKAGLFVAEMLLEEYKLPLLCSKAVSKI